MLWSRQEQQPPEGGSDEEHAVPGPRTGRQWLYPLPRGRASGVEHPDHPPTEGDREPCLPGIPGRHRTARPAAGAHPAAGRDQPGARSQHRLARGTGAGADSVPDLLRAAGQQAVSRRHLHPHARRTGLPAGAPVGGASTNTVFFENDNSVDVSYTITSGKNAMAAGPIEIKSGVTVTVPSGSFLTIV